jgi:hypothetical protein
MASLVRVRLDGFEKNVGASFAESHKLEVLDEPTHRDDGTARPTLRAGGRRVKPKTTVAKQAAAKKKAAVIESAPTDEEST